MKSLLTAEHEERAEDLPSKGASRMDPRLSPTNREREISPPESGEVGAI
jgi:hypothetical protein